MQIEKEKYYGKLIFWYNEPPHLFFFWQNGPLAKYIEYRVFLV